MTQTKLIPVQTAIDFNTLHWPPHNRRQGIECKQDDFALGAFEEDECLGVAIYKVVGSRLMKAFEAHASELGCHVVQLETAETQAPGFYERNGYERIGT